jgi:hypothetical protein
LRNDASALLVWAVEVEVTEFLAKTDEARDVVPHRA